MKGFFGIANASVGQVHRLLYKYRVAVASETGYRKGYQILLVPTLRLFRKLMPTKGVVVVFDAPLYLDSMKDLKMLDSHQTQTFRYVFDRFTPKVIAPVIKALKSPEKSVDTTPLDFHHSIVENVTQGTLLDKYNMLFYCLEGTPDKILLKSALLRYLFEGISIDDVQYELENSFDNPLALSYMDKMLDFLETEAGNNILMACREVKKTRQELLSRGKPLSVPYAKIIKKYEVDRFELKYLSRDYYKNCPQDDPALGDD